jgi:hypothetical protein
MIPKTQSRNPELIKTCTCLVVEDPETALPAEYYTNDMLNRRVFNKACEERSERLEETQ